MSPQLIQRDEAFTLNGCIYTHDWHNILLISETKIDDSFPTAWFFIRGFSAPCRQDQRGRGWGLLLFFREDVSSRILIPKVKAILRLFPLELI